MSSPDSQRYLFSWGWFNEGVLGYPRLRDEDQYVTAPRALFSSGPTDWISVRSGAFHVLALAANGDLYSWGRSSSGRLGYPTTKDYVAQPTLVNFPKTSNNNPLFEVADICCGAHHSLLLTSDGKIYSWGSGYSSQLGHGNRLDISEPKSIEGMVTKVIFKKIAAGYYHSMAVDEDGKLWIWGSGEDGQLGLGSSVTHQAHPKQISFEGTESIKIEYIAASDFNSVAITDSGEAYIWGNNRYSQLGIKKKRKQNFGCSATTKIRTKMEKDCFRNIPRSRHYRDWKSVLLGQICC